MESTSEQPTHPRRISNSCTHTHAVRLCVVCVTGGWHWRLQQMQAAGSDFFYASQEVKCCPPSIFHQLVAIVDSIFRQQLRLRPRQRLRQWQRLRQRQRQQPQQAETLFIPFGVPSPRPSYHRYQMLAGGSHPLTSTAIHRGHPQAPTTTPLLYRLASPEGDVDSGCGSGGPALPRLAAR